MTGSLKPVVHVEEKFRTRAAYASSQILGVTDTVCRTNCLCFPLSYMMKSVIHAQDKSDVFALYGVLLFTDLVLGFLSSHPVPLSCSTTTHARHDPQPCSRQADVSSLNLLPPPFYLSESCKMVLPRSPCSILSFLRNSNALE